MPTIVNIQHFTFTNAFVFYVSMCTNTFISLTKSIWLAFSILTFNWKKPKKYWHYGIYFNKYTYQKRWKLYLREWFRTKTNMYEIKSYLRILQKRSQIQTYTYICCWHNVHSMNSCRRYILLKQVKSYGYTLLRLASQCRK